MYVLQRTAYSPENTVLKINLAEEKQGSLKPCLAKQTWQ